jgi:autotransporter adhesin
VQQQIANVANGNVKYVHTNSTLADSSATGTDSTAIGAAAVASSTNGVAIGNGATVSAAGSVALGAGAVATRGAETYTAQYSNAAVASVGTVSIGSAGTLRTLSNVADAAQATDAVNLRQLNGAVATANAYTDSQITSVATGGQFVVGNPAGLPKPTVTAGLSASGNNTLALGNGAQATADNSVALGSGSVANRAGTVSVGAVGAERQIANVAAGTADTDAVNAGQLNTGLKNTLNAANAYTDNQINALRGEVDTVRKDAASGAASAIAMASMPQAYLPGKSMMSAGVGSYGGQSAISIGISSISDNGRWVVKLNGSAGTSGQVGVGAGAGFHW